MPYTVTPTLNQSYGPDAAHQIDQYRPDGLSGPLKGVLMVPGGGWYNASRATYADACNKLAALGYCAFTISYRVLPTYPYPAQIDDVELALQWVKSLSFIDASRVCVWGQSAGAYAVAFEAVRQNAKCVIAESGIYDLVPAASDPLVIQFLNGASPASASPKTYVSALTRPMMLVHGSADVTIPVQQSIDMKTALDAAGPGALFVMFTGGHGPNPLTNPETEAEAIWQAELAFLDAALSATAPGTVTLGPGVHSFTVPEYSTGIEFDFAGGCGGGGGDNTSSGSKATGGGVTKATIDGTPLIAGGGGGGAGDTSPNNTGLSGTGENAGLGGASAGKGGKGGTASGGSVNANGAAGGDATSSSGGPGGGTTGHKGGVGGDLGSGSQHGGGGAQGGRAKRTSATIAPGTVVTITVGSAGVKGTGQANGSDGSPGFATMTWQ